MEIPVLSRVSDFEASITSLNTNPISLISRIFSILQLGRSTSVRHLLYKWTPLLLALIYTLSSVARRIRVFVVQRRRRRVAKDCDLRQPLMSSSDYDSDVSSTATDSDDDEEEVHQDCSSSPSDDDESNLVDRFDADFRVAGRSRQRKFKIRRKRSWGGNNLFSLAELVNGKSVVKFWDGLGLKLDFNDDNEYESSSSSSSCSSSSKGSISILDLERDVRIGSILGEVPAVSMSSPTVVFTASSGEGKVGLSSWDVRLRRRKPAMEVEWKWPRDGGNVVGVNAGGVDKVYVRSCDGGGGGYLGVTDMRKAELPLGNVTELDGGRGETWWDADGSR